MGTLLRLEVEAPSRGRALRASEAGLRAVRESEERLSTWRSDTELAVLNAAPPGHPIQLSPELFGLLSEVAGWSARTAGALDPAVGALVDAWDLRGRGRRPDPEALGSALAASGLPCFTLLPGSRSGVRRCPGAWIDAGAFGKGAALRGARRALLGAGARTALLNFGGQLLLVGEPPQPGGWTVAVAHPGRRAEAVAWLRVPGGSVATTSASERWVEAGDTRIGHVLDPRTGRPVPPWGGVTVVSDDPLVADALSTALFVMGPEEGPAWAEREEVAALFLTETASGLALRASPLIRPLLGDGPAPVAGAEEAPAALGPGWRRDR